MAVFRASAVNGFGGYPAGVIVFTGDGGIIVFRLHQAAQRVIAEGGGAENAVAVTLCDVFIRHLVGDVIAAVQVRAVREGGADTAASGIVFAAQRAPGKIGFGNKLPGPVIRQPVAFALSVDDFGQAGKIISHLPRVP